MNVISHSTIDRVKQVDIVDVIGRHVSLKKNGHRHTACCPFHQEKSPSFSVSSTKQIFKCFGCGASGDAISFIMKQERLAFIDSIKLIASSHGIPVEFESLTDEEAEAYEKQHKEKESIRILLTEAAAFYQGNTIPADWLTNRKFEKPILNNFKAGYAEATKNALHLAFTKQGWTNEQLVKAGLVREVTQEGKEPFYYDFFQERIIFPIQDLRGNVIAFSGRLTIDEEKNKDDANTGYVAPKYINSPDSVWIKGNNLYGLHLALDEIKKKKSVYLVEGNPDVLRFHQAGIKNVVAPCGTALTIEQIKLLRRFTTTVIIVGDNDAAGRKAVHKNAHLMIEQGMDVKVLMPKMRGADPDDYIKTLKTAEKLQDWLNSDVDYISGHLLGECMELAEISAQSAADEIKRMATVILSIPDDILRSVYHGNVAALWPAFKKNVKLPKSDATTNLSTLDDDARQQLEEQYEYGFYEKRAATIPMKESLKSVFAALQ